MDLFVVLLILAHPHNVVNLNSVLSALAVNGWPVCVVNTKRDPLVVVCEMMRCSGVSSGDDRTSQ